MTKKVLILYISRLSGHFHAAEALEKGFRLLDEDVRVEKLNTFSYLNPILEKIINRAYMGIIHKKPEFWGRIYDDPEVLSRLRQARERVHKFNMPKISKLIEERLPDIIVCTQAFPCGMVADYKAASGRDIPLIGVLTDFAPHSYWIFDEVDDYVVPAEFCRERFVAKGVDEGRIKVLGIPIDPKFRMRSSKIEAREKLGLRKDMKTVLVMGGTQGLGSIGKTVKALSADPEHDYQVLVVTGANKKLYRHLRSFKTGSSMDTLHVYDYIDFVDVLMDASDILVTKAGGLTVAEAMAKRLPLLIMDPLPGQERLNTDHLVQKNAAVEVTSAEDLHARINGLFDNEEEMAKMKDAVTRLSFPESSMDIARTALGAPDPCR